MLATELKSCAWTADTILLTAEPPLQLLKFYFYKGHMAFVCNVKTVGPWSNTRTVTIGNKSILVAFEINWTICHWHDCPSQDIFPLRMLLFILSVCSILNSIFYTSWKLVFSMATATLHQMNGMVELRCSSLQSPQCQELAGKGICQWQLKRSLFYLRVLQPRSPLYTHALNSYQFTLKMQGQHLGYNHLQRKPLFILKRVKL